MTVLHTTFCTALSAAHGPTPERCSKGSRSGSPTERAHLSATTNPSLEQNKVGNGIDAAG